jgi:hypothetical protein
MENQQRIVELLVEQNELLKKHLVRLKFSLLSLLLLMTATCCGLGFVMWTQYHPRIYPIPFSAPTTYVAPGTYGSIQPAPSGNSVAPQVMLVPSQRPADNSDSYSR